MNIHWRYIDEYTVRQSNRMLHEYIIIKCSINEVVFDFDSTEILNES